MSDCTSCGREHLPMVHHLERAIAIQREARDPRGWPELIDRLPEAAKEPVRRWLDEERKRWCDGQGRRRKRGA